MVSGCTCEEVVVTVLLSVYSQVGVSCVDTAAVESQCDFLSFSLKLGSASYKKDSESYVKSSPMSSYRRRLEGQQRCLHNSFVQ